jgi:pimeloyl-ACP methyl ester carboxylesterase
MDENIFRTGTPQDKWVFAGGLNLHYLDWNNEEKQPVLLLHGLQDCASRWDFFAEKMASD